MVLMNTAIFSFSNTDKYILLYFIIPFWNIWREDLFTVANYVW